MKFPEIQTLKQIAEIIDARYIGADDFPISGTNEIHRVKSGEIVFVNHPKYYEKALNSEATVILKGKLFWFRMIHLEILIKSMLILFQYRHLKHVEKM